MEIRLEELTREQVLRAKHVFADARHGNTVIVRRWRGLLPLVSAETPAPLMPDDLFVTVPLEVPDPVAALQAALEYLGFQSNVRVDSSLALH